MLVIHHAAEDLVSKEDHDDGIETLIVAGRTITEELARRF